MKKRVLVITLLFTMLTMCFSGCSSIASADDSSNGQEDTSDEHVVQNADMNMSTGSLDTAVTEYNELEVKTDWDTMATVTFSNSGLTIEGDGCSDENGALYITEGGAYIIEGSSSECAIVVNTDENVKIILNGVDLTNPTGPVIYGEQAKNLYVELSEGTTNTLTDGSDYDTDSNGDSIGKGVIFSEDDLILLGTGTLNINGNFKHGIVCDDKLYIEDGTYNIVTTGTDGIHANDLICIDGGTIDITAPSDLMQAEELLVINGGTITGTSEDEGIESKNTIIINGGYIDISLEDDGLNAADYIEINGGTTYITCTTGDAVDCNGGYDGCIVVNDGFLYANGGNQPEGGIDADNSAVTLNGGVVIEIGAVNSPIDTDSEQVSVVYGSFNASDALGILDSDGNTLFAINPVVSGSTMIISIAGLKQGSEYNIYTGGSISGTADNYGYYSDGIYSGGSVAYTFTVDSQVIEAGGSDEGMDGGMGGMQGGPSGGHDMNQDGQGPQMDGNQPQMDGNAPSDSGDMPQSGDGNQKGMGPHGGKDTTSNSSN